MEDNFSMDQGMWGGEQGVQLYYIYLCNVNLFMQK